MCFFIGNHFGVVAAAIQGDVDCEDYISHLITFGFEISQIVMVFQFNPDDSDAY